MPALDDPYANWVLPDAFSARFRSEAAPAAAFPASPMPNDRLYALQDANWNVIAIAESDPLPTVVERYAYSAYGEPTFLADDYTSQAESQYAWQYLFTGLRGNENTGLTYARHRDYHLPIGTWFTRDHFTLMSSTSLYLYAHSSPEPVSQPLQDSVQAS
jgi:RHS repeat-associated protein